MFSTIRVPEGHKVYDLRRDGEALPQEALNEGISCEPANWRDLFLRDVYTDDAGNGFCLEYRPACKRLHACIYLVHPVQTEEDAENEPFTHTLEEKAAMEEPYEY